MSSPLSLRPAALGTPSSGICGANAKLQRFSMAEERERWQEAQDLVPPGWPRVDAEE